MALAGKGRTLCVNLGSLIGDLRKDGVDRRCRDYRHLLQGELTAPCTLWAAGGSWCWEPEESHFKGQKQPGAASSRALD